METIPKSRFHHIDLMESIAILFVVIYHSIMFPGDFLSDRSFSVYFSYFFSTILCCCVPLFFFANGYLLFNRSFNLKKHIRKMVRILFIILVWAPINLLTITLLQGEPLTLQEFADQILYLDTTYLVNRFWFLGALLCIYLLFPALKALYDSNLNAFIFTTAIIALFTFGNVLADQLLTFFGKLFARGLMDIDYPLITMLNPFRGSCGYSFVYFCTGGLLFRYEDRIRAIPAKKRNLTAVLGICVCCGLLFLVGVFYSVYIEHMIYDVIWYGYDTIFTFCNVIFIYILSLNHTKNHPFIQTVSLNTLGIYTTHTIVIALTYFPVVSVPFLRNVPANILYATLVICCCLCLCFIIKKIPVLKSLI